MASWVHSFGGERTGRASRLVGSLLGKVKASRGGDKATINPGDDIKLLGGKGAGLVKMSALGLPVPPGFVLTTQVSRYFFEHQETYPAELQKEVASALADLERQTKRKFGSSAEPLLVAVRSGASESMPGMMDTILNLGLNDETVEALAKETGDPRFAYDCYRRFIQMFSDVVLRVDGDLFEEKLDALKLAHSVDNDLELSADALSDLIDDYKQMVIEETDNPFPQTPEDQLWGAIAAVFNSWKNPRAAMYRSIHGIDDDIGTGVTIQTMVFGNKGDKSATGVMFTRNPSTGEKELYGEFLQKAQGEDIVAGIRTPQALTEKAKAEAASDKPSLETAMPDAFQALQKIGQQLERDYRDVQDIEFTIEDGSFYILQTRSAKRTTRAALRIAVEMVAEKRISKAEAINRIDPSSLDQLLHPTIRPDQEVELIARGLPASPGAATGEIVFTSEDAETKKLQGKQVILVRQETSPEDVHGMLSASAVLTSRGGMTSHAAVVARGMGKPCICGAGTLRIDYDNKTITGPGLVLNAGDVITVDGSSGQVLNGSVAMVQPVLSGSFATLMEWADDIRRMNVRTNADTAEESRIARDFGAEGIGLYRTEQMFFDDGRIDTMRRYVMADTEEERQRLVNRLLNAHRADFSEIFDIMSGLPLAIRLYDSPLGFFLPSDESELEAIAKHLDLDVDAVKFRAESLREVNPMIGHRASRLAITNPEIAKMQVRAIIEAAIEAGKKTGSPVMPEIMVPLISMEGEFAHIRRMIDDHAKKVMEEAGTTIEYMVGSVIETPRAAFRANRIADNAHFFTFGSNDLTQQTFGMSRDDAFFLEKYEKVGVIDRDPFVAIDIGGVGELMKIAAERGRATRPDILLGICGEHGGDPVSIEFCEEIGLDYVSCSPFRVPIARLAAAQAALHASKL